MMKAEFPAVSLQQNQAKNKDSVFEVFINKVEHWLSTFLKHTDIKWKY